MAAVTSRDGLIEYCLRRLGEPVIEVNVDPDQLEDRVDEAFEFFQEFHSDATLRTYHTHLVTATDVSNTYIDIPSDIDIVSRLFPISGSINNSADMFSVKYQLFLNDIYGLGSTEILSYAMTKRYLEDLDFALNTEKQIRFNQRQDRLYLDIDWGSVSVNDYLILDCYRTIDPSDFSRVYNDSFLKRYLTALIKRQWGQNLIKFQGVKLPGGTELNGRQIYDDGMRDLEIIREQMSNTYELPPLDMIG